MNGFCNPFRSLTLSHPFSSVHVVYVMAAFLGVQESHLAVAFGQSYMQGSEAMFGQ